MANSAHVYRSRSGNWNISFHHPICREGTIGKKVHRSLKVGDESEARRLQLQMNELLALADTPSRLPTRSHAVAEQRYARVVIDAFFDCMSPEPVDYAALRERVMPLPPERGNKGQVPRVLVVGPTAAGKSRFIQHLLQTTRENFPMRGAGRTTVADIETIVGDFDFAAAVTFYTENEIRVIIGENILEACAFAHRDKDDKTKIASKLLVDSDKRFRFNFVLGDAAQDAGAADENELDVEDLESDLGAEVKAAAPWSGLESCVTRVLSMSELALETARRELQPASAEDEQVVEEYWLQYVDQDELDALTEEILGELEQQLCAATGQASWPVVHSVAETADKAEFFARLRPYYQNNRKLFGALVTPLVQGIRVQGRFTPPLWEGPGQPTWVLIDGQGIGHEQGGTKINRTVPPELARRFSGADVICLVDRAVPAMTGDAPILLENLVVRGHQDRLALVFTHFENVAAPDLDFAGRKAKVLEGLSSAIQAIGSLPKAQRVLLEHTAESKAYFLSRLDQPELKLKSTQAEIRRLCEHFRLSLGEVQLPRFGPLYNEYQIANVLRREIENYRQDWSESELASYNWKIMEALTNWIGHAYSDGYPKRNLYPGQDLSQRLVSAISNELESPIEWTPTRPDTAEEESRILNAVRSKVGDRVDGYCRDALVRDPRIGSWLPAYENIHGPGTKVRRARTVARILEDRAQLPNEGLGKFTKDIWQIVEDIVAEVCSTGGEDQSGRLRQAS